MYILNPFDLHMGMKKPGLSILHAAAFEKFLPQISNEIT